MNDMLGFLFAVKYQGEQPVTVMLAWPEVRRDEAVSIAASEMRLERGWSTPRQALFLRRDGIVELFDLQKP